MPERIQLSRRKGWRMPENTVSVARPGKWGNPFKIGGLNGFRSSDPTEPDIWLQTRTIEEAVANFRWLASNGNRPDMIRAELRGKNLACWCKPGDPCHADVLLELANAQAGVTEGGDGEAGSGPEGTSTRSASADAPYSSGNPLPDTPNHTGTE